MTLPAIAILLAAVGLALIVAEVFLPTHGLVGLLGGGAIVAAVAVCFFINQWLGLALATTVVVAMPVAAGVWVKLWPKTPVGRRMFLPPPPKGAPVQAVVHVGDVGRTVSELRPMGTCEFGQQRVEARSEQGVVAPGRLVRVVAFADGHPTVRPVEV